MGTLAKLISDLETAIRYLLTGAVVTALIVASTNDSGNLLSEARDNLTASAFVITATGFVAFTAYRIVFWIVGDAVAWRYELSAPCIFKEEGKGYNHAYSQFLRWRHSDKVGDALSGYLTYRWAVAHFASVAGLSMLVAALASQAESPIFQYKCLVSIAGILIAVLGVWQSFFFYRVERDLCRPDQAETKGADNSHA